jgi:glycosyltransferase involved in cell wall biosynthesis
MKSMKPKLLFIYPNQFGYHTDSYKYCEYLRNSFDIFYICFDNGLERLDFPGIKVIYMPYNTGKIKRLIHFFCSLIQLTYKEDFQILFTIHFKLSFIIGLFAKANVKILDYRSGNLSVNNCKRSILNLLIRFDSFFFQHISVISEGLRDILYLNKQNTLILPLGADVISNKLRSFDHLNLLYVGALNLRNIDQTIKGIALFISKQKEQSTVINYTIIGFGKRSEEQKIITMIENMGLSDYVFFLGRKKYTDLNIYFNTSNIGVAYVPIKPYYEYQPVTKLFEYLLSGMPVIATNTHENRLVMNNRNGVLINDTPEDFCNGLMKIYEQRKSFESSEIKKSVESYTWEHIVKTILKPFLQNLIEMQSIKSRR